jgi:hypothetical protein
VTTTNGATDDELAALRVELDAIDRYALAATAAATNADVAAQAAHRAAQAAATAAGRALPEHLRQLRALLGLTETGEPWPPVPDAQL